MNTLLLMLSISLSMFIGTILVFFVDNKKEKMLGNLLGFSCGIIIALLVFDIFSEIIEELNLLWLVILAIAGYFISKSLDKLVPSHETHSHGKKAKKENLMHVGIITFIGIMLHNITEGIALFTILEHNTSIFMPFVIGIVIHNIPLGIALASPMYYSTNNKKKTLLYTLFAVLSTLIGGIVGLLFTDLFVKFNLPIYILGITAGMMSYVVIDELLPTARKYNKKFIYAVILGILAMFLISFLW